jgi:hypothetical protein
MFLAVFLAVSPLNVANDIGPRDGLHTTAKGNVKPAEVSSGVREAIVANQKKGPTVHAGRIIAARSAIADAQDDLKAISESARDLAYRQLDEELQSCDNYDAKTVGVLGFDGAGVAAILATKDAFHGWWGIPASLLLLSTLWALLCIRSSSWDVGPDPKKFYDEAIARGVDVGSAAAANAKLVSELGGPKGAIAKNEKILAWKAKFYQWALATIAIALLESAVLLAFVR